MRRLFRDFTEPLKLEPKMSTENECICPPPGPRIFPKKRGKECKEKDNNLLKTINLVIKTVVVNTTDQQFMNLISSAFFIFHM